ncbi:MAG: hypothetical protein DWQ34_21100 [Planctomycetota bacterium]|nr:MAG: hypothetical protein DWQ34_21100 [Planctomycetota bacterium]REJ93575.1 MAG: hypothetical protein DWQ29_03610 [Planctomycetota bacterium]REK20445.1 MAG: hypothetical protein DWQ41_25260 [Planctomycetota bacterium]REK29262.1 MAG: hypothetical protein DWQ45_23100 [Planctomycetota bacterium]
MAERPKHSKEARQAVTELRKSYADSLEEIAERIARHKRLETVQRSHIERAQRSLTTGGETLQPFYKRREFQTGAGCFVASAALAVVQFGASGLAAAALMFIIGAALAIYGWVRP